LDASFFFLSAVVAPKQVVKSMKMFMPTPEKMEATLPNLAGQAFSPKPCLKRKRKKTNQESGPARNEDPGRLALKLYPFPPIA
jgi:hypothetical protein